MTGLYCRLQARIQTMRKDPERGLETLEYVILAAVIVAVAVAIGLVIKGVIEGWAAKIPR